MARVASCPQCSHEILILDDSNQDAWAKCPECRAFFQIKQAEGRQILPAVPIEEESADYGGETVVMEDTMLETFIDKSKPTLSGSSDITTSEYGVERAEYGRDVAEAEVEITRDDELTTEIVSPDAETSVSTESATTLRDSLDQPVSSTDAPTEEAANLVGTATTEAVIPESPEERLEDASNRIDKWFRKTKSQVEAPLASADENQETAETNGLEIELPPNLPENQRPWDDSDHVESLLADVESANAANTSDEHQFAVAGDPADSHDELVQVGPIGQRTADQPQFFIPPGRLPRRHKSLLRTMTTYAVSAIVGLALGYYALLWILGPTGDFLDVAQHLPAAVLPAEFQSELAARPIERRPVPTANEALPDESQVNDTSDTAEQASYTAESDNRYGDPSDTIVAADQTSSLLEEPTAAPITPATDVNIAKIANAPSFSADQLAVALQAAKEAQPSLVKGNFKDGQEVLRAKGFGYSVLCDLAQKLLFVDRQDRDHYANALVTDAERLFRQTLADTQIRSEIAHILPMWIRSSKRTHGGAFFAGTPSLRAEKGTVVECQFDVGTDKSITVLIPPDTAEQLASSTEPVGIVGWIVDSPAKTVSGYTGDAPQAVWAGRLLTLE